MLAQGKAPIGQLLLFVEQTQMAHACVVRQFHAASRLQRQAVPDGLRPRCTPYEALGGQNQQAFSEIQSLVEVNLQPS